MNFENYNTKHRKIIDNELDLFLSKVISELDEINPFIKYCYDLIKDYSKAGKRIRAIAVLLSYELTEGKELEKIIPIALAVELLHTYTLILDDVMDEDEFRRGQPTVYKNLQESYIKNFKDKKYIGSLFNKKSSRFAVSFSIILANITNILSKKLILRSEFPDELKTKALFLMNKVDRQIYHGQIGDILSETFAGSEEQYLEMIRLKTGVLFGLSFDLGSLFSGADETLRYRLKKFATNTALSYQIKDDILDISERKGHEQFSDIKKGKYNLLMIKTLEKSKEDDRKFILKTYGREKSDEYCKKIVQLMKHTSSIEYCMKLAKMKNSEVKDYLSKINVENKQMLYEFVDYMVNRTS